MLTLECKHLKTLISVSISLPIASLKQGRNLSLKGEQECIITVAKEMQAICIAQKDYRR